MDCHFKVLDISGRSLIPIHRISLTLGTEESSDGSKIMPINAICKGLEQTIRSTALINVTTTNKMMHKLQHTDSEFLQEWFHSKGCWLDWFGHWPWPVLARRSSTSSSSSNRAATVMMIKLRFLDFLSFKFFSRLSRFSFCWGCCFFWKKKKRQYRVRVHHAIATLYVSGLRASFMFRKHCCNSDWQWCYWCLI